MPKDLEFNIRDKSKSRKKVKRCHRPYANLTIFSDGSIVACEEDYNAGICMGNVRQQSLSDIIRSDNFRKFLIAFNNNPKQFKFCAACDMLNSKYKTHNVKTEILKQEMYDYVGKA